MTLIERINSLINAVASDIKSLYANKVNKTDVIAVAQGGTGGTDAGTALGNLGLILNYPNVYPADSEATYPSKNPILQTGSFGLGAYPKLTYTTPKTSQFMIYASSYPKLPPNGFYQRDSNVPTKVNAYDMSGIVVNGSKFEAWALWFSRVSQSLCVQQYTSYGSKYYEHIIYSDINTPNLDMQVKTLKSGAASYKKGWRKLTTTLPSQEGEVTLAHGVTTVEMVQAKVTNSDGIIIYNNDIDPANQFYVRVNGANLVLGVTANSTKVFGKTVTIYVGEEL